MTYLNQFHKEAMERTMKKIVEFKKSPMNSKDFADYMRRNLEMAKQMEIAIVLGTGTWVTKRRPSTTCPRDCSLLNCSGFPNCCRFFQFTWDKTHLSPASQLGVSG